MRLTRLLAAAVVVVAVAAAGAALLRSASSGQPTAESPPRFCSPESTRPACSSAHIGVEYELSLYTHCGVGHTYFDDRYWIIEPTQPDAGNHVDGVMQLVTRDLAYFRGEGLRFAFEPAPSSFAPPPCY
jgi:hypothetical protein